LCYCVF